MADIYLHNRKLGSVFELLGSNENDITYSIGWALSECPSFLTVVLCRLFKTLTSVDVTEIRLQTHKTGSGITDVEILGPPNLHVIIEAKRGLQLPGEPQLRMYAARLKEQNCKHQALVAMAECQPEYASPICPRR